MAWFAQRDSDETWSPLNLKVLVWAGKVSFAFYMVHLFVIIKVSEFLVGREIPHVHGWSIVLAFLLSCALAAVLHHLVEMPAQRAILSFWQRRRNLLVAS